MDAAAAALALRSFVAASVDYRLAPAAHYPAQIEDVQAAVGFLRAHAPAYGIDSRRIGVLGVSAGGQLAALLGTRGSGPLDRGDRVAAVVSWSGPMDLSAGEAVSGGLPVVTAFLGCDPTSCPQRWADASPVHWVDSTDPPVFIANSVHELVPLAQATEMAAVLRSHGVPYELVELPGSLHASAYFGEKVPGSSQSVWEATLAFLRRNLGATARGESQSGARTTSHWTTALLIGAVALVALFGVVVVVLARRRRRSGRPRRGV